MSPLSMFLAALHVIFLFNTNLKLLIVSFSFSEWLTQLGKDIKQFQSYWGGEFWSFTSMLTQHGIIHWIMCPQASKQNGVVERKLRHIVEVGLTLLAQVNLLMKFWGYTILCAVHLINHLPITILRDHSPYLVLYGKSPTYSHLWIFRCCCFPHLCPFNNHKLEFLS